MQNIPYEDRISQAFPIPCRKHGDPRRVYPENEDAFFIYAKLYPGDMALIEMQYGERTKRELFLRTEPIKMLCEAYDVDFIDTYHKLELIHKAWTRHGN